MAYAALRGPFVRVTLTNFLFFLNFASFFLLPLHIRALGGSERVVGMAMGSLGLATLAVLPWIAVYLDRFGRKRFLLVGCAGMALAAGLYPQVDRVGPMLFGLRLLQGVSFAAAFTAATTFAAALAPVATRAKALGMFGLSTLVTHALAPGLGEELIRRAGFTALFYVAMGWAIAAFALATTLPDLRPAPRLADDIGNSEQLTPTHWRLAVTTWLGAVGFGSVITFVPTFVGVAGLGRVGAFFASYTTTAVLVRFVGSGLSDRFGRRRVVVPALLGLALAIAGIGQARSGLMLVACGGLFGLAQGIAYPTLHAFVVDISGTHNLGRAQALFNGAFNFGVTGSAFFCGAIAEAFGHRAMFTGVALTPVLAAAFFFWFLPPPVTTTK